MDYKLKFVLRHAIAKIVIIYLIYIFNSLFVSSGRPRITWLQRVEEDMGLPSVPINSQPGPLVVAIATTLNRSTVLQQRVSESSPKAAGFFVSCVCPPIQCPNFVCAIISSHISVLPLSLPLFSPFFCLFCSPLGSYFSFLPFPFPQPSLRIPPASSVKIDVIWIKNKLSTKTTTVR